MGYYKSTMYYGPNAHDFSDKNPEAVAERQPRRRHHIATNFDSPTCNVCLKQAPDGLVWVDGICDDCNALTLIQPQVIQAICPRCGQKLGTNSRNCTTCYEDVEGRD